MLASLDPTVSSLALFIMVRHFTKVKETKNVQWRHTCLYVYRRVSDQVEANSCLL
jgi:hypothetical protein